PRLAPPTCPSWGLAMSQPSAARSSPRSRSCLQPESSPPHTSPASTVAFPQAATSPPAEAASADTLVVHATLAPAPTTIPQAQPPRVPTPPPDFLVSHPAK